MGTIKLRRGSGSPAGSLAQYEVAMDVADKTLYTSSDGSDAVIIGADPKHFLANNTISGITNVTTGPLEKAWFKNQNTSTPSVNTGIAIARDLTSDGAVSGREPRSAGLIWTVLSDSGNTNGSAAEIYPGGITMESGSNDGSSPNWIRAFTYDDGISTFSEETLFEGTKNEFHIYPKLNTNGIKNVADNYSEIAAFESKTLASANTVGIELQRNLSTDGAVSGRDTRGVSQTYGIYSDAGNTNGSAQYIYPGGLAAQSGSNDGTSPHWLVAFTYDNGITSFSEEKLWEGTKDEFHVYPPTEFHAPVQFPSYDLNAGPLPSSPVAGMMVYNTDTNKMAFYNGTAWTDL